jgi:hypothetical protein
MKNKNSRKTFLPANGHFACVFGNIINEKKNGNVCFKSSHVHIHQSFNNENFGEQTKVVLRLI